MRADEPAFPTPEMSIADGELSMVHQHPGLSIREHLAGLAMQGMLANSDRQGLPSDYAADSVAFADALIAALAKPTDAIGPGSES